MSTRYRYLTAGLLAVLVIAGLVPLAWVGWDWLATGLSCMFAAAAVAAAALACRERERSDQALAAAIEARHRTSQLAWRAEQERRRGEAALAETRRLHGLPPLPPSFTCPKCDRTSYNPDDVEHSYCGACSEFTGTVPP